MTQARHKPLSPRHSLRKLIYWKLYHSLLLIIQIRCHAQTTNLKEWNVGYSLSTSNVLCYCGIILKFRLVIVHFQYHITTCDVLWCMSWYQCARFPLIQFSNPNLPCSLYCGHRLSTTGAWHQSDHRCNKNWTRIIQNRIMQTNHQMKYFEDRIRPSNMIFICSAKYFLVNFKAESPLHECQWKTSAFQKF